MTEVAVEDKKEEERAARIYELGFHVAPTVPEEKVGAEVTAIRDVLQKEGAVMIAEEFPKQRLLSYPMRKRASGRNLAFTNAYFGWMKYEAPIGGAKRLEAALKGLENILRCIVVETVREQTVVVPRVQRVEAKRARREAPHVAPLQPPPVPVSDAELEKSLQKIIAE
jgi:ribosomal protein S6